MTAAKTAMTAQQAAVYATAIADLAQVAVDVCDTDLPNVSVEEGEQMRFFQYT